jgi:hypothetical protein
VRNPGIIVKHQTSNRLSNQTIKFIPLRSFELIQSLTIALILPASAPANARADAPETISLILPSSARSNAVPRNLTCSILPHSDMDRTSQSHSIYCRVR